MQTGFDGTSLAVFTGLAPCGVAAFMILGTYLLLEQGRLRRAGDAPRMSPPGAGQSAAEGAYRRVAHLLACPLVVAWTGFIASATHLGTPANALYAFTNVGSSPLSNEVAATVSFLFFAGVLWLCSFSARPRPVLERSLMLAGIVSGAAMLFFTSRAYAVPTVPTWDVWLVPVNYLAGAACGGPALAALVLTVAETPRARWTAGLLAASALALAVGTALLAAYVRYLGGIGNNVVPAGGAVGAYPLAIAAHCILAAAGLAIMWFALRTPLDHARRTVFSAVGCLLVLAGMVVVRFPFYAAYLSVGF